MSCVADVHWYRALGSIWIPVSHSPEIGVWWSEMIRSGKLNASFEENTLTRVSAFAGENMSAQDRQNFFDEIILLALR